jgi:hypothetical protein
VTKEWYWLPVAGEALRKQPRLDGKWILKRARSTNSASKSSIRRDFLCARASQLWSTIYARALSASPTRSFPAKA